MIKKIFATAILFSAFAVGLVPSAAKEEQAPQAKRNRLPENSGSVQIKTDSTGWVDFNGNYAHIDDGNITIDGNSTDAVAGYNSESNTLVIYNAESSNLISGIKAAGDFDFKVSFEKNFDEDHLIAFELDCDSAELTSLEKRSVYISYLFSKDLTLSGNLTSVVTFFKDSSVANAFFDQSIDPPHNTIFGATNFYLKDNASLEGTNIYNMNSVAELFKPSDFSIFAIDNATINTCGYIDIGMDASSKFPTDYKCLLEIKTYPSILKCDKGFTLRGVNGRISNDDGFIQIISGKNINYHYYTNFQSKYTLKSTIREYTLTPLFHATNIEADEIAIYNDSTKKNFTNYAYDKLKFENGVVVFEKGCNYNNLIIVEPKNNRKVDLVIRFEEGSYGAISSNYNKLLIINKYGNITLTTGEKEAELNLGAVSCTGILFINGNLSVKEIGTIDYSTASSFPFYLQESYFYICQHGLISADILIAIEENASVYAVGSAYGFGFMGAGFSGGKVVIIQTERLLVTTNKSVTFGSVSQPLDATRYIAAFSFPQSTSYNLIRHQKNIEGATFKVYRYKHTGVAFTINSSLENYCNATEIENSLYDVPDEYENVEVLELTSNCKDEWVADRIITFAPNGGTGSMSQVSDLIAYEFYKLPECEFNAPTQKKFAGWAFTDKDPKMIKQPGELVQIIKFETEIYPVWEDVPVDALTGTVSITGSLKYDETLTASVTDTNNTGTLSYQWRRNGDDIASATSSTYKVSENDIGYTLSVKVSSSIETGFIVGTASGVISKADGHSAPTGISAVACTTEANNDGVLKGVTTEMEYKLSTLSGWADGTGVDITGLASGTYNVRFKATSTRNAGEIANVVVNAYNAPIQYAVTVNKGTANPVAAVAGTTITITADAPEEGYVFDKWISSSGVVFADANSETTTFTMPEGNVTVTATYKPVVVPPTPTPSSSSGLSGGAIAGIIIASILVAGIGGFALVWFVIKKKTWADFVAIFKKK